MNKITERVISLLSLNSRSKLKDLKENLPISKQGVLDLINKLERDKIIRPYTIINYLKLGKKNVHIKIKFEKINIEAINQTIKLLLEEKDIVWISETFHTYDLCFSIMYNNYNEVEKVIKKIRSMNKNKIKEIAYLDIVESYYSSFNFGNSKIPKNFIRLYLDNKTEIFHPKRNEKSILELIRGNSRFKYSELGHKLNLTPNSTKYIIKELEKKEIILGYGLFLDYLELGYKWFQITIKSYLNDVIENFYHFNNIVFLSVSKEGYIVVDYVSKDIIEIRNFINNIELMLDKINEYEINEIVNIHKLKTTISE